MKKKILAMCLVVALLATAIVGATMAYFTDTDSAKNVMTTGNVDIAQNEYQRDEETGELEDFEDNKPLMPRVDTGDVEIYWNNKEDQNLIVDGYFNPVIENTVDKIIKVKNEAPEKAINQDVYVRTIIAFETATEYVEDTDTVRRGGKEIFDTYIGTNGSFKLLDRGTIKIDGVEYVLAVKVYENALAPQQESDPSLKQIFLSPDANNEVARLFGSEYTILAVSQGVQTAGFGSAAEALDEAFGDLETIEEAKLIEWLEACK